MKNIQLLIILFLLNSLNVSAQVNKDITGKIINKATGLPVEFANVTLLKAENKVSIKSVITDSTGKFLFKKVPLGKYIILYSFIDYNETETPAFLIMDTTDIHDLGSLILTSSGQDPNEVVVTGEKQMYENSIDKKVFNVAKDVTSQSGSLAQAMQNVPSVSVDMDGNVSYRGSENVTIFINGKPSTLMGAGRGTALQQIPASAVERIEIISNPSAKYKPDGTAGIINIVLKKNAKLGLNGSSAVNAGNHDRYNGNLSVNYNPGKINFFANYGIRKDYSNRYYHDSRIYTDTSTKENRFQNQNNAEYSRPVSHLARLGTDINLNDKNQAGVSSDFYYRKMIRNENTDYLFRTGSDSTTSQYVRYRYDKEYEYNIDFNAYYQHNFNDDGHELLLDYTVSKEQEEEDNHFNNIYQFPQNPASYDNTLIRQGKRMHLLTLQYTLPISEESEFEAGYMGQFDKSDLNFRSEYYNSGGLWTEDKQKTNRFISNQAVHAFYGTYSSTYKKIKFIAGLRAEQTLITSKLLTLDSIVPNNYFQLFPTIHLGRKFNKSNEIKLNYSRRVNRPEGDELNPFPEYLDPRNLSAGNPKLRPENIHSVEFAYQWKNDKTSIMPTLFYRQKYNGFTRVTELINDSTLFTTNKNLTTNKSIGFELIGTKTIGKFLTLNITGNAFYNRIDASNLGLSSKKSNFTWTVKWNSNFTITKKTLFQLNSFYQSSTITAQGKMLPRFALNMGVRQDFKKCSITLAISDILHTLNYSSLIDTPWLYQKIVKKRQSQIIYLGLSYRFGISGKKTKVENLKYEDKF
jgi:outer membrane receptor protein involved in Fe transport